MSELESGEVTALLAAWSAGDQAALERLTPLVYTELRRLARRYMRGERAGNTLQTTALINEVYLRLVDVKSVDFQVRGQFFAVCAQMMRRILVDAARARGAQKRGGGVEKLNIEEIALAEPNDDSVLALDAALEEFAKMAPRQAKIVELRSFGGLAEKEIAQIMGLSTRTVERDWIFAKSWLIRELRKR
jgi:RNA polymerase sigma factor (TIGR02999 family)